MTVKGEEYLNSLKLQYDKMMSEAEKELSDAISDHNQRLSKMVEKYDKYMEKQFRALGWTSQPDHKSEQ